MNRSEQMAQVLHCLNSALEADGTAIRSLFGAVYPANGQLVEHPTIEVGGSIRDRFKVSPLGVLNGALRAAGIGTVAVVIEGDGIVGFKEFRSPETDHFIREGDA